MLAKTNINESAVNEIPIFFSTDDNYAPFLDVAITSLIENASRDYKYRIIVLNTGLNADFVKRIKRNESNRFTIDFIDISADVAQIKSRLKNVYHFSIVTYYRLFIASLFPQYDKIVYLDCDLVVLGDISEMYRTELGDNIIAATPDLAVRGTDAFRRYAKDAIGVDPDKYVNAGVLVINLTEFRRNRIEEKFVHLITEYDFDLLDPDQAYLNYLCSGKIYELPKSWNQVPLPFARPSALEKNIVHYALYKKPWEYSDVEDGEFFWQYAKKSAFYEEILARKAAFGDAERAQREAVAVEIVEHADKVIASDVTFVKKLRG